MRWLRDNTDLVAIAVVALAMTAEAPVTRIRTQRLTQPAMANDIRHALTTAKGEIRRTLRTSTALHRYNDWTCR